MKLTPTIDLLELAWSLLAACGIVLHVIGWRAARRDVAVALSRPDLAADVGYPMAERRAEFWRAVLQSLFLSVGLMVMTLPGAPPGAGLWRTIVSVFSRAAFIASESIMIYLSAREQIEGAARVRRRERPA